MKAVMFDFDGTITKENGNVWRDVWDKLGYYTGHDSLYKCLYYEFMKGNINHDEWCDLTCKRFRQKGLTGEMFMNIAGDIELMPGASETFKKLYDEGYSLHIVSGNFKSVIEKALGDNVKYFDNISANDMYFDSNGVISAIKGTEYDFDGKALYIERFRKATDSNSDEIIFVGNGDNDEWAHLSGCKTICLNPDENVEKENSTKWHKVMEDVTDLTDILPVIDNMIVSDKSKETSKKEYVAPSMRIAEEEAVL